MHQFFITAHVLIFMGYESDHYDGMKARWRNKPSETVKKLDSFSDLVCTVHNPSLLFSNGTALTISRFSFFLTSALMLYNLGLHISADL